MITVFLVATVLFLKRGKIINEITFQQKFGKAKVEIGEKPLTFKNMGITRKNTAYLNATSVMYFFWS